jgi:glycosyltransferase involved in cell wall biosynthesis
MTTLSIVTVCLNECGQIGRTAESISQQTHCDYEWIVVDGGSTDGTVDLLMNRYKRLMTHCVSKPDHGIYDAMNIGAGIARGEWLLFLNGGDVLAGPDVVAMLCQQLDGAGREIAVGAHRMVWPDGRPPIHKECAEPLDCNYFYRQTVNHQSTVIGKKVFEQFGPYDTSFRILGDYDFFVKAALGGVVFRRIHVLICDYDMSGISSQSKRSKPLRTELKRVRRNFPLWYRSRRLLNDVYTGFKQQAVKWSTSE